MLIDRILQAKHRLKDENDGGDNDSTKALVLRERNFKNQVNSKESTSSVNKLATKLKSAKRRNFQ